MTRIFHVPGKVCPKGRPRFSDGKVFTPKETKDYENLVLTEYLKKYGTCERFEDKPLLVSIVVYVDTPKCRKEEAKTFAGKFVKTNPDVDNYAKSILDALNGFAYKDDSYVSAVFCVKKYAEEPGAHISISTIDDAESCKNSFNYAISALLYNNNTGGI